MCRWICDVFSFLFQAIFLYSSFAYYIIRLLWNQMISLCPALNILMIYKNRNRDLFSSTIYSLILLSIPLYIIHMKLSIFYFDR